MAKQKLDQIPPFKIPEAHLDKLYEFTGSEEATRGFFLVYFDNENRPVLKFRHPNAIMQLALLRSVEMILNGFHPVEEDIDSEGEGAAE